MRASCLGYYLFTLRIKHSKLVTLTAYMYCATAPQHNCSILLSWVLLPLSTGAVGTRPWSGKPQ